MVDGQSGLVGLVLYILDSRISEIEQLRQQIQRNQPPAWNAADYDGLLAPSMHGGLRDITGMEPFLHPDPRGAYYFGGWCWETSQAETVKTREDLKAEITKLEAELTKLKKEHAEAQTDLNVLGSFD